MGWWENFTTSVGDLIGGNPAGAIGTWLTSSGGGIAAGIETGVLAFFKDIWDAILGPLEIILGAIIMLIAFGFLFKNDLMALIP